MQQLLFLLVLTVPAAVAAASDIVAEDITLSNYTDDITVILKYKQKRAF